MRFEEIRSLQMRYLPMAVFLLLAVTPVSVDAGTMNPDDLLELLRAKDAQFDNLRIDFVREIYQPIPDDLLDDVDADEETRKWLEPGFFLLSYQETLVIRGTEVTFIRRPDPSVIGDARYTQNSVTNRKTNVGGRYRFLDIHPGGNEGDMQIHPTVKGTDPAQQDA